MLFGSGFDLAVGGAPRQDIGTCGFPAEVGLYGADYRGLRLKALVQRGDRVARGAAILEDRAHPEIRIVAPASGSVAEIVLGPRRTISTVTIATDRAPARDFAVPEGPGAEAAEALLLESGLWAALVERPFGRVPRPGTRPDALVVMAADTEPNAADPAIVIGLAPEAFRRGVEWLAALAGGPVHVAEPNGAALLPDGDAVRRIAVAGTHPAGLAGTVIDRVLAMRPGRVAWQIGYVDVLALGELVTTGRLPEHRVVALTGLLARDPRLVRLPPGAGIEALATTEALPGPRRALSGSALSGVESRFLRRGATQLTLLPRREPRAPRHLLPEPRHPARRAPFIPHAALDRALGPRLPVVPLLRALSIGDADAAARLGALTLIEEDLALASYLTGGAENFGARLREVLDQLELRP